jgi:hypothetical protein
MEKLRKYVDIVLVSEHLEANYVKKHKFYEFDKCSDPDLEYALCP